ncbi:MAG: tRNA pseudouridine(55) synthase TruB [Candidatus Paceibacterota bacterium]|jgi:tRNA pseudouridine55 synthase|nr:tRNA pseudouridine(55) synthase TruB [bacterium]
MEKIIPIYKPVGFSSFDIVKKFKKETGIIQKVGHGGSLDPFACGVLLLLLGDATKKFEEIRKWKKTYLAGIRLGAFSSTQDVSGSIEMFSCERVSLVQIRDILSNMSNKDTMQKVSPFSAAKHNGQPLYKFANKGIIIEKTKKIFLGNIEIISYKWPLLTIRVETSGGAYIRQLAEDFGLEAGCKSFVYFLERERVGEYNISNCYKIDKLNNILN